jgi:putative NIF3 family GTP cyclohydrolase 1 type 2
MKEITTVITAEITVIKECKDEQADMVINHKPEELRALEKGLKRACGADDVTVAKVQYFVMDKAGGEDGI